jgi:hypothetical protein
MTIPSGGKRGQSFIVQLSLASWLGSSAGCRWMLGESGAGKVLTEGPHSQIAKDPQRRGEDFGDRSNVEFECGWRRAKQRGGLDRGGSRSGTGQLSASGYSTIRPVPSLRSSPFDLSRVCAPFRCAPFRYLTYPFVCCLTCPFVCWMPMDAWGVRSRKSVNRRSALADCERPTAPRGGFWEQGEDFGDRSNVDGGDTHNEEG